MIVLESELEDFNNAILSKGLSPSGFELEHLKKPMQGGNIQPIIGQVTVRRKSTDIQRTYKAGHMSHWVADFVDDFKRGIFN